MGLHVWDLEWRFLVSPLQRFSEAGAGLLGGQSVPEWPRLAPGSSNICLPSSHSSGQQPALCGAGVVMLVGLLSLLRAEVSTVARLSFVSCVSQDSFFFPCWQIISTQLILNFLMFVPAVKLLA